MGPCIICAKMGSFGAPHPKTKNTVWACLEHKSALPERGCRNYEKTDAEDREAAMRYAAAKLSKAIGKEQMQAIGREAFEAAFNEGLDAYFAMRLHQLEP